MAAGVFVMAILGCADGGALCTDARILPTAYTSFQACLAATTHVLPSQSDLSYPELMATCRSAGPLYANRDTSRLARKRTPA